MFFQKGVTVDEHLNPLPNSSESCIG